MSQAASASTGKNYGLALVCRVWALLALSPRHFDLHHAVFRAVNARNPGVQKRLELTRV